ncbi:MAG: penicillin-binding protein 2 [Anaerolineae bacterium]|nr:penicillin-binding protein 2 [Anaerolineae bacterium]
MRQQYAWRSLLLNAFLAVMAAMIVIQIIRIQTSVEAEKFREQADQFAGFYKTFYPQRGEIYDRNGHLLAGNQIVYEIGVYLNNVRDPHTVAMALSVNLNRNFDQIYSDILNPPEDIYYLVIEKFASPDVVADLKKLKEELNQSSNPTPSLFGLEFNPRLKRSYPEADLASNLLGFVNLEGRGYFGTEEKYNDLLAGNPIKIWVPNDPNRVTEIPRIPNGTSLILTINRELQDAVEDILDQSLLDYGAQQGTIVVMNPKNGEIMAMASTPRMDLNNFENYGSIFDNASEYNRAIGLPYEPGSVMKIFTMAAALDTGIVNPNTTYLDTGYIQVSGVGIKNWDENAWGAQTMLGCLQHSLNVCLSWVATQLGPQSFYGYMKQFGFGYLTGLDMAGEAAGRLKVPGDADWYPIDLATNSFGQGITATPIQMLTAASAFANQGRMVTPHILYAMLRDGIQFNVPPQHAGTPIKAETAATMSEMLAVSLENEGSEALVPNYRMAGKTGTAQIPTPYGFYDFSQTNASFIGWGPVDDPQIMIYVWLERPTSSIWGSETAAPVFSVVAQKTMILLNIPPDNIRQIMTSQ